MPVMSTPPYARKCISALCRRLEREIAVSIEFDGCDRGAAITALALVLYETSKEHVPVKELCAYLLSCDLYNKGDEKNVGHHQRDEEAEG